MGDKYGTIWIVVKAAIQFDQYYLLKTLSCPFLVCIPGLFIKNQMYTCLWISIWDFS